MAVGGPLLTVALLLLKALSAMPAAPAMPLRGQLEVFRNGKLWTIYATSPWW